mgnify:FL=1
MGDSMTRGEQGVLNAALDRHAELLADNIRLEKTIIIQKGIIALLIGALILRWRK